MPPHPHLQGKFVDLATNLAGFKAVIAGEYDSLPENAFYMQGSIAEVREWRRGSDWR